MMQHFIGSALVAKTNSILRERKHNILKIITCGPSVYTTDHSDLHVSNKMENSIGLLKLRFANYFGKILQWLLQCLDHFWQKLAFSSQQCDFNMIHYDKHNLTFVRNYNIINHVFVQVG